MAKTDMAFFPSVEGSMTSEDGHTFMLLLLAQRWEKLALKAATNRLVRLFQMDADAEAARRSRRAYELGDILNFHLWARIARAAMQLRRKASHR
jgi:hypothetical protein